MQKILGHTDIAITANFFTDATVEDMSRGFGSNRAALGRAERKRDRGQGRGLKLMATSSEKRILLAIKSAQNILARHVEPGGPDAKATIDALLTVLDDDEIVEAMQDFAPAVIIKTSTKRNQLHHCNVLGCGLQGVARQ